MNKNTIDFRNTMEYRERAEYFYPLPPRRFRKGEVILDSDHIREQSGLALKGLCVMKSVNAVGEESILDYFSPGDIFGGVFTPKENVNLYYIVAKSECEVCFRGDKNTSEFDEKLKNIFFEFASEQTSAAFSRQLLHTDVLSQRTIRGKLLTWFNALALQQGKSFTLPLSLTDTADFIAADRSAMMRELKKLNEEGILVSKGQDITLHDR